MSEWKFRQNGDWHKKIPYIRDGTQWVPVEQSTPDIPDRFYANGPPVRDGNIIRYPDDGHSSLEDAIMDASSGDEVYVPGTDTYNETVFLDYGDVADNITVRGDLELSFDSDGAPIIAQDGATFRNPDGGTVFETDREYFSSTTPDITSPANRGDTSIEVSDASSISAGQVVAFREDSRPFDEPSAGGSSGSSETFEFATVESVDGSTINLKHPLLMGYPLDNGTDVYDLSNYFVATDFRLSGLRFDGNYGNSHVLNIASLRQAWFDNLRVLRSSDSNRSGGANFMRFRLTYETRLDGYFLEDGTHYGAHFFSGATANMATNGSSRNHSRYTLTCTSGSFPSAGTYADGLYGEDLGRSVGDVHLGGFDAQYYNVTADDSLGLTPRSSYMKFSNIEVNDMVNSGTAALRFAQRPTHVTIDGVYIPSTMSSNVYVFAWRLRDDNNSPYGNERFEDVTIENVTIEDYGRSIDDIGTFQIEGDPPVSSGLTLRNVTYDGQDLTRSHVESWSGYDEDYITNLIVE